MNIRIGFWLLCLISLVACKGKTSGVQDTLFSGVIRVAVDETLSPLAEEEIAVLKRNIIRQVSSRYIRVKWMQ